MLRQSITILILIIALVLGGTQVAAQEYFPGLLTLTQYATAPAPCFGGFGICAFDVGVTIQVHVMLDHGLDIKAIQDFSVPMPECFEATYLSDTAIHDETIGNSQTSVTVGLAECTSGVIHVLTINYFVDALTPSCCIIGLANGSRLATVRHCNDTEQAPYLDVVTINPTAACVDPDCPGCYQVPLPTKPTTWGRVKALYDS